MNSRRSTRHKADCNLQAANPSGLSRSRARRSMCPNYLSQCSLGGSAFECVDTQSDLEQCGDCASRGGVDCSAMPGVASVECVEGACVASTFTIPFRLIFKLTRVVQHPAPLGSTSTTAVAFEVLHNSPQSSRLSWPDHLELSQSTSFSAV